MAWSLMWWTTSKGELSSLYGIIHNKYGTAPELISFLGKCYHWNVSFNQLVGVRIGSLSWIYFILVCGKGRWWISWAGKLLPRGFLWFDLAIKSYYPLLNCLFLGRLCGNLKCQPQFFPMDDGIGSYFN